MSRLEALLLTSIDDEIPLTKIYPLEYSNYNIIVELKIIAENFKNCGKGSLQHKNRIFYYRTYIPTLPKGDGNSVSNESFSDYFIYSYDCKKKKFFLLILCDLKYKLQNVDNLTISIFDILDNAFEGHELKQESSHKINTLFLQYKKLQLNLGEYVQLKDIVDIKNDDSINSINSLNKNPLNEGNKSNKESKAKKRLDSRMIFPKVKKSNSSAISVDIDDLTSVKESDTELSIMFKRNFELDFELPEVNKWKKIKFLNIILCSVLLVIIVILCITFRDYIF